MTRELVIVVAGVLAAAVACGGPQRRSSEGPVDFDCNSRRASYAAVGTLMYQEQGIRISCEGNVPLVEQWFVTDEGQETKKNGRIPYSVWIKTWKTFENAGWRNLQDCDNPGAGERDAMYTFEVGDADYTKSFGCQGNQLPFPYDTLQLALDQAAGELPSDETAE